MAAIRGNEIGPAAEAKHEAERREAEAVAALHELNAEFVGALGAGVTSWYATHLSREFVCTLAGGRRVGRAEFQRRVEVAAPPGDVACDEIDVHPLGEVALVHGAIHAGCASGFTLTRYTAVWQLLGHQWEMIAVQFTPVTKRRAARR
jgi:hypothetical protein